MALKQDDFLRQQQLEDSLREIHESYKGQTLSSILTIAYFFLAGFTVLFVRAQNDLSIFLVAGFVACIAVYSTKYCAAKFGVFLSTTILSGPPFNNPLRSQKSINKFADQAWQLVFHTVMSIWEVRLLASVGWSWWEHPELCWEPPVEQQVHAQEFRIFHLSQLAFYIVYCFAHRFVEEVHKDYYVMFIHHVTTIFALISGYWLGLQRISLLTLFVHDPSDIFIDLAKLSNALKTEGLRGLFLTELFYVGSVLSWAVMRLWYFPIRVIYSAYAYNPNPPQISNATLLVLYCLHWYWFWLLLRIGIKLVLAGKPHEIGQEMYEGKDSDDDD